MGQTPPLITSWGNRPVPGQEVRSENLEALTRSVLPLSRGLGRSYGDSSYPAEGDVDVVGTVLADRLLEFNPQTGVLRAEAGFTVDALIRVFLKRGFFTPVTPGTKFVTLGGMVASDVHGKNHHSSGCFGEHVRSLKLRVADGRVLECSMEKERDLFTATLGGMGLTGHILEVEFVMEKIPSPWIWAESERVPNIEAYVDGLKAAGTEWPMTMGWIDCLSRGQKMGRGILSRGRWARADEAPASPPGKRMKLTLPQVFPSFTINPLTTRIFNTLYYWKHLRRKQRGILHPDSFFYPLDGILHWNRVYGKRGLTQYQCVIPQGASRDAPRRFLEVLTRHKAASFLCVIKDCGAQGRGLLSFPMPGISIAVDIAIRADTPRVIAALNEFVISEGGRIYLTKDTFTTAEHFSAMEKRLPQFWAVKRKWDPRGKFRSAQSVRMLGGE
jgi:decaprenylphospho-beta-D-ribofuranose 2-oxidase